MDKKTNSKLFDDPKIRKEFLTAQKMVKEAGLRFDDCC